MEKKLFKYKMPVLLLLTLFGGRFFLSQPNGGKENNQNNQLIQAENSTTSENAKIEDTTKVTTGTTTTASSESTIEKSSETTDTQDVLQTDVASSKATKQMTETTISAPQSSSTSQGGQKVRLNVMHQLQRTATSCAPTTVSMLLAYKGIDISQEILADQMGTDNSFGTHNSDAIGVLNRHLFGYDVPGNGQAGYRLATVTNPEADKALFKERLKQNIDDDYPMYYTIELSTLYPNIKAEHNVLGVGYQLNAAGNDIEYVYYLDPAPSIQDPVYGGLKKITVEELLYSTSVCVEPNYGW
ncbi:C39 family peptidase [Streptococcus sp. S784/96/1]|uniref:C39 family peptidase n=1 Tax=Streptococcus sp. S784/96/1 TaxID=2653499 RepID=UPI001EE3F3A1|nr:C39 family peptidase [Streptococcus sp. S784/96/1]